MLNKKYLIILFALGAVVFLVNVISCTNKEVMCNGDSSFSAVSNILVNKCDKCHKDAATANLFGRGVIINGRDSFSVINFINTDGSGGILLQDIEGTGIHPMPLGGPSLSSCEISTIRDWITNYGKNAVSGISCGDSTYHSARAILVNRCGSCHGDSTQASNYANGYWIPNDYATDSALGLIQPGIQDSTNLILQDIERGSGMVHPMPLGGTKMTDCEIATIRNWLWVGAPNN